MGNRLDDARHLLDTGAAQGIGPVIAIVEHQTTAQTHGVEVRNTETDWNCHPGQRGSVRCHHGTRSFRVEQPGIEGAELGAIALEDKFAVGRLGHSDRRLL